jgi:S-disulfanyl-L-cysteine oxidoreductase SoxD
MRPGLSRNLVLVGIVAIACASGQTLRATAAARPPAVQGDWQARSVWDGAYTEDQAKRGEALYRKNCSACHGSMLTGGETASPLTGATFYSNWNGLGLDELFERIRRSMPQDKPGKLSRQVNADILAYVLSFNKFPPGKTELPAQSEFLKQIRFESTKPDARK